MEIRQATMADIPVLVALNRIVHTMHVEAFPGTFRRDPPDEVVSGAFKAAMESPTSYWLLAEEERAVGFLSADFRQRGETWHMMAHRVCYIGAVVVEAGCRRKGIARALLAKLKDEARSREVTRIELDVWAFNVEARRAFASLGFRPVMERMALPVERENHGF
jgi:ribosomal protein S18 acetylase RimI-like enzyme